VRAIRFDDATGAYGAYTFYRQSGMPKEEIGQGGASNNNRVLFWTGNTIVDATFDHVTSMSASELRELAKNIPAPSGSANVPPPLPRYLPTQGLEPQSTHYSLGDFSYTHSGGVLPAALVDFGRGAEALSGQYQSKNGGGTLTLLIYPTPQLAADRERALQAFITAGNTPQAGWSDALAGSNTGALAVRRSGPLVAVTDGVGSAVSVGSAVAVSVSPGVAVSVCAESGVPDDGTTAAATAVPPPIATSERATIATLVPNAVAMRAMG
jgi:hypothetical protein